jgi:hypothetical protein
LRDKTVRVSQGSVGIEWEENTIEEYEEFSMSKVDASLNLPNDRLVVARGTPAAAIRGLSLCSILRTVNGANVDGVDFEDIVERLVAERSKDRPLVLEVLTRTEVGTSLDWLARAAEAKKAEKTEPAASEANASTEDQDTSAEDQAARADATALAQKVAAAEAAREVAAAEEALRLREEQRARALAEEDRTVEAARAVAVEAEAARRAAAEVARLGVEKAAAAAQAIADEEERSAAVNDRDLSYITRGANGFGMRLSSGGVVAALTAMDGAAAMSGLVIGDTIVKVLAMQIMSFTACFSFSFEILDSK